ncbi:hypothetical protein M378DRAFT_969517 [Amanita muscaria Koide BX008]|uniref:Uncharacterized protein n=1 Tax=Amanita muscaria (strain Koide BX008) TaxID=946122 RepID=A0A0C2WU13_AMAMK|nr:hypothetical protein M378DRAFT_969517 [Amanita muscaria Koide BX008]
MSQNASNHWQTSPPAAASGGGVTFNGPAFAGAGGGNNFGSGTVNQGCGPCGQPDSRSEQSRSRSMGHVGSVGFFFCFFFSLSRYSTSYDTDPRDHCYRGKVMRTRSRNHVE